MLIVEVDDAMRRLYRARRTCAVALDEQIEERRLGEKTCRNRQATYGWLTPSEQWLELVSRLTTRNSDVSRLW